jgi:RimJ/RimL family protein N-acetyltransferase
MSFRPDAMLTTDRLRLRPPRLGDAREIFDGYAQDPEVTRYTSWTPHESIEATRQFLRESMNAWKADTRFDWIVYERATKKIVGGAGARVIGHTVEIGYVLARSAWGRGYATEAAQAIIDHALADPEVWRVQAHCSVDNPASVRVMEKCGMRREGRLGRAFVFPSLAEEPGDVFLYAVTK